MTWMRSRLMVVVVLILLVTAVTPLVILALIGLRSFQENSGRDIATASELLEDRTLDALETRAADIAYDLAFSDPSHFARFFRKQTGTTPHEFREGRS